MKHWIASPEWEGLVAVVIGGGESFTAADARMIGRARSLDLIRVIAVNDAVYPCWFADIAYACDARWWRYHGPLPGFPGKRLSLDPSGIEGVDYLFNGGPSGFDPDPGTLRSGGNSCYQAVHLAAHLRARTVILVGVDMRGAHWFGQHPAPLRQNAKPGNSMIADFVALGRELAERMTILNASVRSELTSFRMVDLGRELEALEQP